MGPDTNADSPIVACLGMSIWKQRRMRQMLTPMFGSPAFPNTSQGAVALAKARGGAVGVWATREPADLNRLAQAAGTPVVRIEDGFIRSVGLGADFMPAVSIVCDRRGIYYDPSRPSDLEIILEQTQFTPDLLSRAEHVREAVVARGVTKYNTGSTAFSLATDIDRRRLFVPGQVEDDQSVALGGAGLARNLDLLKAVRAANPQAYIVYKPHPDVDAGHRLGAVDDTDVINHADLIARGVSTAAILGQVDEVHTITSLAGFEGLLRGLKVIAYGQPFYAGWGLTEDRSPIVRRGRKLSLNELVAGALILYPYYFDPVTGRLCEVEMVIERLAQPDLWRPSLLTRVRRLSGRLAARVTMRSRGLA